MNIPSKAASLAGAIFLFIFGGIFATVGLVALLSSLEGTPQAGGAMPALLGGIFGLTGLGMMGGGIYSYIHGERLRERAARYPGQPWMLKESWASGRIEDSSRGIVFVMVIIAVAWNSLTGVIILSLLHEGAFRQNPAALFIMIFPAVGLVLAGVAIYFLLRFRKYGVSVFEMSDVPGVLGGHLGGVILTRAPVHTSEGLKLRLRNIHMWSTGSGKSRKTHRETLWEREQTLPHSLQETLGERAFPVLFTIPYSCEPTNKINANKEYYWELTLSGKAPGIDYKSSFRVPVFKTEKSSAKVTGELSQLAGEERQTLGTDITSIPGLVTSHALTGGELLQFRPLNASVLGAAIASLVSIAMLAIALFFIFGGVSPFIAMLIGAIALMGLIPAVIRGFGSTQLGLHPDRIEVTVRLLGFPISQRIIPRQHIDEIKVASRRLNSTAKRQTIRIHLTSGQSHSIPLNIRNPVHADIIADRIRRRTPR